MQGRFHSNQLMCHLLFLKMYLLVWRAKRSNAEERKLIYSEWIFSIVVSTTVKRKIPRIWFFWNLALFVFLFFLFVFPAVTLGVNKAHAQHNNQPTFHFLAHAFKFNVGIFAIYVDHFISSTISLVEYWGMSSSWRNHKWEPVCGKHNEHSVSLLKWWGLTLAKGHMEESWVIIVHWVSAFICLLLLLLYHLLFGLLSAWELCVPEFKWPKQW